MSKKKTIFIVVISVITTVIVVLGIYVAVQYTMGVNIDVPNINETRADIVLSELNIDGIYEYAPESLAYSDTHGGFHYDGITFSVIKVGYANRDVAMDAIKYADGWTVESISTETQHEIMSDLSVEDLGKVIGLMLDTDYDAWYFSDNFAKQNGAPSDFGKQIIRFDGIADGSYPNFTIAFFDYEEGLLLYFKMDS